MKRKGRNFWTKLKCKAEALKYKKRSDFKKYSGGAYNSAKNNNFLDEICSHMIEIGNRFKRLVYIYTFSDKSVYVGLTQNIEERDEKHKRDPDSSVYKHIKKTGLTPELSFGKYMIANLAQKIEGKTVEVYKNKGYYLLNQTKTGALGGENIKWTYENCRLEALKYQSRTDFARKSNSAYNAARRYKWIDDICSHIILKKPSKIKGYWTKERCIKEAMKYKNRNDFNKKSSGAYMSCFKNGWLNDVCLHMLGKRKKPNGYWKKDNCKKEAKKYNSKTEFQLYSGGAYRSALKNGWLNEICIHYK